MKDRSSWRCAISGCERPWHPKAAKGLCKRHYDDSLPKRMRKCAADGCDAEMPRKWCNKHRPTYARDRVPGRHLARYGLTPETFAALLEAQGGGCAVCGITNPPHSFVVDHDHGCCPRLKSCGRCVRGILCRSCNVGIGLLGDDAARALSAHQYLSKSLPRKEKP